MTPLSKYQIFWQILTSIFDWNWLFVVFVSFFKLICLLILFFVNLFLISKSSFDVSFFYTAKTGNAKIIRGRGFRNIGNLPPHYLICCANNFFRLLFVIIVFKKSRKLSYRLILSEKIWVWGNPPTPPFLHILMTSWTFMLGEFFPDLFSYLSPLKVFPILEYISFMYAE